MHRRRFVGREIIQHHVNLEFGRDARVDLAEERHEILGAMLLLAPREDFAGGHIEGRKQIERSMAHVVYVCRSGCPRSMDRKGCARCSA